MNFCLKTSDDLEKHELITVKKDDDTLTLKKREDHFFENKAEKYDQGS